MAADARRQWTEARRRLASDQSGRQNCSTHRTHLTVYRQWPTGTQPEELHPAYLGSKYEVHTALLLASRTWSDTDRLVVSVTHSILIDVTRVIPGSSGGLDTLCFRLLSTNIISFVSLRLNCRLLTRAPSPLCRMYRLPLIYSHHIWLRSVKKCSGWFLIL